MSTDLEFHVESLGETKIFKSDKFDEACAFAVQRSLSGTVNTTLDVVCWSEDGAANWGGSDAVEAYREDPEASVFERIIIKAFCLGRVP